MDDDGRHFSRPHLLGLPWPARDTLRYWLIRDLIFPDEQPGLIIHPRALCQARGATISHLTHISPHRSDMVAPSQPHWMCCPSWLGGSWKTASPREVSLMVTWMWPCGSSCGKKL